MQRAWGNIRKTRCSDTVANLIRNDDTIETRTECATCYQLNKTNSFIDITPWLMEPGGSMPHSQGLSNNSNPEPNQPNSPHLQGPF